MKRNAYSVASVLPFWRWAVAIVQRPDLPAVPFYREVSALQFANEIRANFPDRIVHVLRRSWRGVEVAWEIGNVE